MELRNEYLLQGTEGFAKGELEGVTVGNGALSLEGPDGQYHARGFYTSPVMPFVAFDRLMVSWNAETPPGTLVEAQVRVRQEGVVGPWRSFGSWSPFLPRAGVWDPLGRPGVRGGTVRLDAPADQLQLRIRLETQDEAATPVVRLLAVSVRPLGCQPQEGRPIERELYAPAYGLAGRDPAFGPAMDLPVAAASLMNHWGADILPEELAHAMYDRALGSCGNLAFGAAAVGSFGCRAWAAYRDLGGLRAEIRAGCPAAVLFSGAPTPQQAAQGGLPLAEGLAAPAGQRMLVVRGFAGEGQETQVLLNDPADPADPAVGDEPRRMPLGQFMAGWQEGITLLVRRGEKGAGGSRPQRSSCQLQALGPVGSYRLEQQSAPCPLPAPGGPHPACTLAYTGAEPAAHPTTAHKHFTFLQPGPEGEVQLPPEALEGGPLTVYAVDCQGRMMVAELGGGR